MPTREHAAWMVTAIIFIVLFVITMGACVYMCMERHRIMRQLYPKRPKAMQPTLKHHPNHHHHQQHRHQQQGQRGMEGAGEGYF